MIFQQDKYQTLTNQLSIQIVSSKKKQIKSLVDLKDVNINWETPAALSEQISGDWRVDRDRFDNS